MLSYIVRRVFLLIPTIFVISVISFIIIQLPPGDFLTAQIAVLQSQGQLIDQSVIDAMQQQYGLDQPIYVQYYKWMSGILFRGDFGMSLQWRQPVSSLIWERLELTVLL